MNHSKFTYKAILFSLAFSTIMTSNAFATKPKVVSIYAVSPTTLALVIQEKNVKRLAAYPYVATKGDVIAPDNKKGKVIAWKEGKLIEEQKVYTLTRGKNMVGYITANQKQVMPTYLSHGESLNLRALKHTTTYDLQSNGQPSVEKGSPSEVWYKRKPNQYRSMGFKVVAYLKFTQKLMEGQTYILKIHDLTEEQEFTYTHSSKKNLTEIIHVSHVGFRPDDPAKDARISLWLGTGGAFDPAQEGPIRCALLHQESENVAWEGEATLIKKHTQVDELRDKRNMSKTDVYGIDFSSVTTSGTYRIWVKGVGVSHPFPIGDSVWLDAFKVSMQGLLSHRSGIELPTELMGYERPRNMHPVDGFKVLPINQTMIHGEIEAVQKSLSEMMQEATIAEPMPHAWGGYMDAGDWDRRSQHLYATQLLLETYESNPSFWNKVNLILPADEATNSTPDLLDEAWWNLSFYHRIQNEDGGVSGGIESTSHPRGAEASWQETLGVGCFAPDPVSSLRFAAAAAHYARLTSTMDSSRSQQLQRSALKAWEWARGKKATMTMQSLAIEDPKAHGKAQKELLRLKLNAAIHLLHLTKDIDSYDTDIIKTFSTITNSLGIEDSLFAYTQLPKELINSQCLKQVRRRLIQLADDAITFQTGNSWNLANPEPYLPHMGYVGYLSVPGMTSRSLPRAYLITGQEKYLRAMVRSCGFSTGANPDNMSYTTGIGPNPVQWPLHIDSFITGQAAPNGITIYGPSDPASKFPFEKWVYQWYVGKGQAVPLGLNWPFAEAYWDIYTAPSINEYTIHQTIAPTLYTWGILASRQSIKEKKKEISE